MTSHLHKVNDSKVEKNLSGKQGSFQPSKPANLHRPDSVKVPLPPKQK